MVNEYDIRGHSNVIWGEFTDKVAGDKNVLTIYGHNVYSSDNPGVHAADFVMQISAVLDNPHFDSDGNFLATFKGVNAVAFTQNGYGSAAWDASTHLYVGGNEVYSKTANAGASWSTGWLNVDGGITPVPIKIKPNGDTTNLNIKVAGFFNYPDGDSPNESNSDKWDFYIDSVTNNYNLLNYVPMAIYSGSYLSLNKHQGYIELYNDGYQNVGTEKIATKNQPNAGNNRFYDGNKWLQQADLDS